MFDRIERSLFLLFAVCLSLAIGNKEGEIILAEPAASNVHLECGIPTPKWAKDNKTIEASDTGYELLTDNGTLIIKTIDQNHMGEYVCFNDQTSLTKTVFVTPYVKPFDKTKNIIQDDPLQLECKGYGYPIPVVEWFKGSELKGTEDSRVILKDVPKQADSSVMTNGSMRITMMTFDDAGEYVCVATNIHGVQNATIAVQVKDKLAALWPFLGICVEVAILCAIIFIYERRRSRKMQEEEDRAAQAEEAERLNSNNETKVNDDVRQRKQ